MLEMTVEYIHSARSRRTPGTSTLVDFFGEMSKKNTAATFSGGDKS